MGYTHYWYTKGEEPLEKFDEYAKDCEQLCNHFMQTTNHIIRDYDGTGHPEFSKDKVAFNGDRHMDRGHESFVMRAKPSDFDFCKTARKPYDLLVQACLVVLKHKYGSRVRINSDGDLSEWQDAMAMVSEVLGYDTKHFDLGA